MTSAPASRRAATRSSGASLPQTTISGASPIVATSCDVERQPRARVENDAPRLAGGADLARGQQRVVGERGADPDRDRVAVGAPAVDQLAALGAGDPAGVTAGSGGSPVERDGCLVDHQGQAGARVLAERLHQKTGGSGLGALGELDLDPFVAEDPGAAPARLLGGVVATDHDAGDAGGSDRGGTGRPAALVRAGLEGDVHRRSRGVVAAPAGVFESRHLGVLAAELGVKALADSLPLAAR